MFLIGLLLIIGISRYNESEKLFWTLLISFVGTFAVTTAATKIMNQKRTNENTIVSSAPTQVLYYGSHRCVLADSVITVTDEEKSSAPVSKDSLMTESDLVRSKIGAPARDQPVSFFDTS